MKYLIYLLLLLPTAGQACSCFFTEYFCDYAVSYYEWSGEDVTIVRAQFVEYRLAGGGYAPLYDVKVREVISGTAEVGRTYSLLGQDGGNCNGPINSLNEGAEYIIIFVNRDGFFSSYSNIDLSANPYPVRDFPGCGPSALHVTGHIVNGKIAEGTSRAPFSAFKNQLAQCVGPDVIISDAEPNYPKFIDATIAPNPASESFRVLFEPTPIGIVDLYDINGRLVSREDLGKSEISEHTVNVSQLPAGVYLLVMETDGVRIKKRVVVR
ncbi:T9SS type A sorting domain-containing protein [Neolewinella agarilytica]|uniref:T9SS type A sorting domain-containing protein n=1 Tax=Neolewinella agarilytica TaxID=478744 RepID=UPI002356988E|nr:T9SS type A sorting domain-containing protein [Neolewinella agarilytica]